MNNEKKQKAILDDELASKIEAMTDSEQEPQKNKRNMLPVIIVIIVLAALISGAFLYCNKAQYYNKVYFPLTYINGIDVSEKTPDEARELIKDLCSSYSITVKARDRQDETVKAADVDLHYVAGNELEDILNSQSIYKWYFEKQKVKNNEIPTITQINEDKFDFICTRLTAFDDSTARQPRNAEIGIYDENSNAFAIIPEDDGNVIIDKNAAKDVIKEAMLTLDSEVDIDAETNDFYAKAEIRSNDSGLNSEKQSLDRFVKAKVIYPDYDIVLDGNTLQNWIITDEHGTLKLSEEKITNFVSFVASAYDTKDTGRRLVTQYGNDTIVGGGNFGWTVDQQAEIQKLKTILPEGGETTRQPEFSSKGITHGENDWGNTYVEINLAKQHLFFVKDGKLIVSSDCVTGGLQRRAPTPTGIYQVFYKGRNAVLRGPRRADGSYEYESPVSYWMPFNKGIGLHDAKWRGRFGGTIYRVDGSHGCVNLPLKKAQAIYENIEVGTPVIVYSDDFEIINMPEDPAEALKKAEEARKAEEKKKAAEKKTKTQTQNKPVQQTPPPETAPPETLAPETAPAETAPMEWGPAFSNIGSSEPEVTVGAENLPEEMQ